MKTARLCPMCAPHACPMKIAPDARGHAGRHGLPAGQAPGQGRRAQAVAFGRGGAALHGRS